MGIRSKTMESAEQVEAMETDGTTAASDTVTGEEDYVDIDDLEEFDDEGPPPSDIDDDSGGDMMSDDDEHVQQGAEAEDDLVDEAETVFTGHTDAVYGVTICAAQPDRMATAGGDDVARIWDTNTGECLQMLTGHTDSIACIKFNRDGTLVATGGLDALVMVWRVEDGSLVQTLEGPGEDVTWIDWHSKGNVLVAGSNDCTAWMWNATKGTQMQCFVGHGGAVLCGQFTPDGKVLVSGAEDGTVRVWGPKSGVSKVSITMSDSPVTCLDVSADSTLVLGGCADGTVSLVQVESGKLLGKYEGHTDGIEGVAFCSSFPFVASASLDGTVKVWDTGRHEVRHTLTHQGAVVKVLWHPTMPWLYTASVDGIVRVWDGRDGSCVAALTGHTDGVLDIAISDGSVVLSASDDKTSRLFRLPTP